MNTELLATPGQTIMSLPLGLMILCFVLIAAIWLTPVVFKKLRSASKRNAADDELDTFLD